MSPRMLDRSVTSSRFLLSSLHENLGKRPSDCFAKFPAELVETKPILHPIPSIDDHLLLPLSREHTYLQYNTGHFQISPIFFSRSLSSTSTPSLCFGYQVLTLIIQWCSTIPKSHHTPPSNSFEIISSHSYHFII